MKRISSQMNNNNTQYNLRIQEQRQNRLNNQIGTQSRIQSLRDDPVYRSALRKAKRF